MERLAGSLPGLLLRTALASLRLAFWSVRYRLRRSQGWLEPTWEYSGECNFCGACCRSIRIGLPRWLPMRERWTPLLLAWAARNRPYLYHRGSLDGALIFGCSYLGADNRCTVYAERPQVCRLYPFRSAWRLPVLFDECGYEVTSRDPALQVQPAQRRPEPVLIQIQSEPAGFAGNRPPS